MDKKLFTETLAHPPIERFYIMSASVELGKRFYRMVYIALFEIQSNALLTSRKISAAEG